MKKKTVDKLYWVGTLVLAVVLVIAFIIGYKTVHTSKTVETVNIVEETDNAEALENGVLVVEDKETPSEVPELPVSNEKKLKKNDKPTTKTEPVAQSDEPVAVVEPIEAEEITEVVYEIEGAVTYEEPKEREITGTLLGSDFTIVHYAPTGNATASGRMPEVGVTVAVDKKYIKLGTRLRIEIPDGNGGYKVYQDNCRADDTGGLIKGHKIDVFVASESEARQHGVIRNARVYILD